MKKRFQSISEVKSVSNDLVDSLKSLFRSSRPLTVTLKITDEQANRRILNYENFEGIDKLWVRVKLTYSTTNFCSFETMQELGHFVPRH